MTFTVALNQTLTIAEVQCEEIRDPSGTLVDRKIMLVLSCGHSHFVSLPLAAALPQVGDTSTWTCLPCIVGGGRS